MSGTMKIGIWGITFIYSYSALLISVETIAFDVCEHEYINISPHLLIFHGHCMSYPTWILNAYISQMWKIHVFHISAFQITLLEWTQKNSTRSEVGNVLKRLFYRQLTFPHLNFTLNFTVLLAFLQIWEVSTNLFNFE